MKWSKKEIKKLKKLYSNSYNSELSIIFQRSEKSIFYKASSLNLKKSDEHIIKCRIKRNKMVGRNLTTDKLKEIAINYKTRSELQKNDPSVYKTALDKGILDEICSHMIKQNYSKPQLILKYILQGIFLNEKISYNNRKIISPYELDLYVKNYNIAFEYDGKGWHEKEDVIIRDKEKEKLCKEKNILLIRIIENNRNYITDIKQQLIENLSKINNWCNIEISKKDILNIDEDKIYKSFNESLLDKEKILNIIKKYDNYKDFRKNELNLYNKLLRNKLLHYLNILKK